MSPTGTKGLGPPPLTRLAVGPGTKATYCPGPKGCRDKWPGTKAYSVVVVAWVGVQGAGAAGAWRGVQGARQGQQRMAGRRPVRARRPMHGGAQADGGGRWREGGQRRKKRVRGADRESGESAYFYAQRCPICQWLEDEELE